MTPSQSALPPFAQPIEVAVNDRRPVERNRLTKDETPDNRYAKWPDPSFDTFLTLLISER